ncbi:MAG: hypothetical protein JWL71_1712 [Acidobacteria bacterium]|nr:hypothetical protein [Acidobacteriota bacterium]
MRMKLSLALLLAASTVGSLAAHVMVSPPQSTAGAVQKYELRVHNEAKSAATSIDLDVPDGVTVTEVAKVPAGTFTTKTTANRITVITWQIDVQPTKYVALPFTARNPDSGTELRWTMHEHLADGSVVDWSDKAGAKEKGSVTRLAAATAAASAAADGHTWTGAISDKMCGADHKKMGGKMSDSECTLACTKGGAPYVLVADGRVFQLTDHEADLRMHAGHTVTISGDLKGETITVARVGMVKEPAK